jgi:hypothetical protein
MKRLSLLLLLLVPACGPDTNAPAGSGQGGQGAGGAGGAPAAGGAGGMIVKTANCPDSSAGPVDPTALIDDMEAGGYLLPMEGGRNGSWWAGGDAVSPSSATIDPNGDAASELIPNGGRCGSLHAKHVTEQGFTSWAVLSATLAVGQVDGGAYVPKGYDAHIRTGLTFWARVGDTSYNKVRFAVSDKYTRPEGGICDNDATTSTTTTACYDTAGVDLTLGKTWTQFQIPFGGLGQRNFGYREPQMGPDTSALYTIDFNLYPNNVYDLWIDDIAFY